MKLNESIKNIYRQQYSTTLSCVVQHVLAAEATEYWQEAVDILYITTQRLHFSTLHCCNEVNTSVLCYGTGDLSPLPQLVNDST